MYIFVGPSRHSASKTCLPCQIPGFPSSQVPRRVCAPQTNRPPLPDSRIPKFPSSQTCLCSPDRRVCSCLQTCLTMWTSYELARACMANNNRNLMHAITVVWLQSSFPFPANAHSVTNDAPKTSYTDASGCTMRSYCADHVRVLQRLASLEI